MYNYDVPQSIRDMHKREVGGIRNMIMHERRGVPYSSHDEFTYMEMVRVPNGLLYLVYEYTNKDPDSDDLSSTLKSCTFVPYEEFNQP